MIVWIFLELSGGSQNVVVLLRFGAKYGPAIADGEYWRLLTAVFIHIGLFHLVANSIGLLVFGGMVEKAYGIRSFLVIYLVAGIFGNLASYAAGPTVSAGASGAVFGIVGAFGTYLLANRAVLGELARRSLWGVAVIITINIVFGLSVGGVDNWAHLGGLLSGALIGWFLTPRLTWESAASPFVLEPPRLVTRVPSAIRWRTVVAISAAVLLAFTWLISADYPQAQPVIVQSTVTEAVRSIQLGDYGSARDLIGAMAANNRGGTRLGLFYLQRGLERAGSGSRAQAAADIRTALGYDLPADAARIGESALQQLSSRR